MLGVVEMPGTLSHCGIRNSKMMQKAVPSQFLFVLFTTSEDDMARV